MKKLLFFITVIFLIFLFLTPLLPKSLITINSNVPISMSDLFDKVGHFYYVYKSKLPAKIQRKFIGITVYYSEPVIGEIDFSDGKFAITKNGRIIGYVPGSYNEFKLKANMESKQWSENFASMIVRASEAGCLKNMDSVAIFGEDSGFYDKNGIAVIMGNDEYSEKFLEYEKLIKMFNKRVKMIERIDLSYKNEAVIKWRGK